MGGNRIQGIMFVVVAVLAVGCGSGRSDEPTLAAVEPAGAASEPASEPASASEGPGDHSADTSGVLVASTTDDRAYRPDDATGEPSNPDPATGRTDPAGATTTGTEPTATTASTATTTPTTPTTAAGPTSGPATSPAPTSISTSILSGGGDDEDDGGSTTTDPGPMTTEEGSTSVFQMPASTQLDADSIIHLVPQAFSAVDAGPACILRSGDFLTCHLPASMTHEAIPVRPDCVDSPDAWPAVNLDAGGVFAPCDLSGYAPVLAPTPLYEGDAIQVDGIRCDAVSGGLMCVNEAGHGFRSTRGSLTILGD